MNQPSWNSIRRLLEPFIGLAAVLILFGISPIRDIMFTGGSWNLILLQSVIVALGAMGMTMIIVSGGIDLSAGSVVALTSVIGAKLILGGYSLFAVMVFAVCAGGFIGFVNGLLISGLRMVPFIVTLGMMGITRGIAKWAADNQTVNYTREQPDHAIKELMARESATEFFPLPSGVWITLVLAVIMILVLRKTVFGRHVFAIGSNEATARLCGIRVQTTKLLIYMMAGLFFGAAGVMQLSRLNQGDPSVAVGLELEIIAAVVIGGASLNGGVGSILGSMIGALIMGVLKRGSTLMGWPNYMQEIIIGSVIIFAVWLDKLRNR